MQPEYLTIKIGIKIKSFPTINIRQNYFRTAAWCAYNFIICLKKENKVSYNNVVNIFKIYKVDANEE